MTTKEAVNILQFLMEGRDPETGDFLSFGHICLDPRVRRALCMAIAAMETYDASLPVAVTYRNKKLNAGRPWSEADCATLAKMYRAGTPIQEICTSLQRRERGVKRQLACLGYIEIDTKPEKAPRPGLDRAGKPWTQTEDERLCELYHKSVPIAQIAAQMQRSEYAIFLRMEKNALYGTENGYPKAEALYSWNDENDRLLRELYEAGTSIPELAVRFRCPEKSISARLFCVRPTRESALSQPEQRP